MTFVDGRNLCYISCGSYAFIKIVGCGYDFVLPLMICFAPSRTLNLEVTSSLQLGSDDYRQRNCHMPGTRVICIKFVRCGCVLCFSSYHRIRN